MNELIGKRDVKACRKKFRCLWCGETIGIGDSCTVVSQMFDGEFQSNRYHPECDDAVDETSKMVNGWFSFDPYNAERGKPEGKDSDMISEDW
jgi:hypothetical protein